MRLNNLDQHPPSIRSRRSSANTGTRFAACWAVAVLLVLLVPAQHVEAAVRQPAALLAKCDSEMQIVMCGQIPLTAAAEMRSCCRLHRPAPVPAAAAAAVQAAAAASQVMQAALTPAHRTDLDTTNGSLSAPLDYMLGSCTTAVEVGVPAFTESGEVQIVQQVVPQLDSDTIRKVKDAAMLLMPAAVQERYHSLHTATTSDSGSDSGFVHPGTNAGAAELAVMQHRLAAGIQPQLIARDTLLTGAGVTPKLYPSGWFPPTDTPLNYTGPYALQVVDIKWSGFNTERVVCPANYPTGAPDSICAHVSLIEMDSQMVYKQAMAYLATGEEAYAANALRVIDAWASTNKAWGQLDQNGPLEAGWACASMSKTLELLRDKATPELMNKFTDWMDTVLVPQMDFYTDVVTPIALQAGTQHLYGNWHSTVAECDMAYGLLTDNRTRYDKGVAIYHATVQDYLKFGRGTFSNGRILGECSETLRDVYHSQFGLGGLLQAAEMAWQQNEDLYSSSEYALAAAMELHARVIRAYQANDPSMLPAGFKFAEAMPPAPDGCMWKFDIRLQLWQAINLTTYQAVSNLTDGYKYLVGIMFLPTGWESGYNHYAGRLGMNMPETAQLLAQVWPESYSFHWGLGTLTHAATASELWRPGVKTSTLCAGSAQG